MNLSKPYSVRLPIEKAEEIEAISEKTNTKPAVVMRKLLTESRPIIKSKESKSTAKDRMTVIFHLNKTGNNINQIAKALNILMLAGEYESEVFLKYLRLLDKISLEQRRLMETLF
jgi:predicted DNA-binding protein